MQFTEFRNQSKKYFEEIQEGASFIIVKKGSPVARIIPFNQNIQGWKRSVSRVKLKQTKKTTFDFISEERNDS